MKDLALILPYDYKLLSVAAILDVFETVNRICLEDKREEPFRINVFQVPEQMEEKDNLFHGHRIRSVKSEMVMGMILVPSFTTDNLSDTIHKNREFITWLQKQYQAGAEIASFCTGAFLLGASGLLNGKAATTHVDASKGFEQLFPKVMLKPDEVTTVDGRLYTSGGSTSTFHLLLKIVGMYCGEEMAVRIAKIFSIDLDRYKQSYFGTFVPNRDHHDDLVKQVQDGIETKYRELETIDEIVKTIPSSRRNIVRRFKLATGLPPIEYLQHVRIESAKRMLEQTDQYINEITYHSGYNDPKSFRKTFHKIVGMTPLEYRKKFRMKVAS